MIGPDEHPFPQKRDKARSAFYATLYDRKILEVLANAREGDSEAVTGDRQIVKEGLARGDAVQPAARGAYETVRQMSDRIIAENNMNSFKKAIDRLLINDGYISRKHSRDENERY